MIGPFIGPTRITCPNARLLYQRFFNVEAALSGLPSALKSIDSLIDEHPRLERANNNFYLYFFGDDAKECWHGREIIGHLAQTREPFGIYDTFKGEAFSWKVENLNWSNLSTKDLLGAERNLRSLAGESLGPTWRICFSPIDNAGHMNSDSDFPLSLSFHFFKMS